VLLVGPTASGKSEVALHIAERLGGEIISVDSMQVYRGLDIGTAKPLAAERERVPHHLLDVAELSEPFDAAKFVILAKTALAKIRSRERPAILCGGTGLYAKALLEGLGASPPADPRLREKLEAIPLAELLREIARNDPATFETIDRQNRRRVIRAAEVMRLTASFSAQRAAWNLPCRPGGQGLFALSRNSEDLRQRIDSRVDLMFERGLIAETAHLLDGTGSEPHGHAGHWLSPGRRAFARERSLPETVATVKIRTRQFAKRQMTWFRHQLPLYWIGVAPQEPSSSVAERILRRLKTSAATKA
jgi:tRNA dimethylallyltransferase